MTTADTLQRPSLTSQNTQSWSGADIQELDDEKLELLLRRLDADGYRFITATPATHARFMKRNPNATASSLRDVLGWSLPFTREVMPEDIFRLLDDAGAAAQRADGLYTAKVRVSSVRDVLFLHSSYPTSEQDSVFLGPDSYRFADFIVEHLADLPATADILDYGAGAGVGGITAARALPGSTVTLADVNPAALKLASINARVAGVGYRAVNARTPHEIDGQFDLFVTHPPFMMDEMNRAYRHGGDLYGARLSLDWVLAGLEKLTPGGQLMMHTGVSIVGGVDVLLERLEQEIPADRFRWTYRELDPDIFSEDLDTPPYRDVERIAATGLSVVRVG